MSKITNDGLTQSGTGCFIAVPVLYGNSGLQRIKAEFARFFCSVRYLYASPTIRQTFAPSLI